MDPLALTTPFLSELAAALGRRGKAIRYQGDLKLARILEGAPPRERLDVEFRSRLGLRIDLSVWADRAWNIRVYQRRPGRVGGWLFRHELAAFTNAEPGLIERAFEASMALELLESDAVLARLREIWKLHDPTNGT